MERHPEGIMNKDAAAVRILARARGFYANNLRVCRGGCSAVVGCTTVRQKRSSDDNLKGLMQLLSGRGMAVDVDSEGNLVWRKPPVRSYGGGVGKIGRIDEEKTCSFNELDVSNKLGYSVSMYRRAEI